MGGLASRLPWTHGTMLMATLAIAGIPPFAGFFSKDEILSSAFASGHHGDLGHGPGGRGADRVLHVPPLPADLPRPAAAHARGRAPPARVAAGDDRAALRAGGALGGGRPGRPAAAWRAATRSRAGSRRCSPPAPHEGAHAAAHERPAGHRVDAHRGSRCWSRRRASPSRSAPTCGARRPRRACASAWPACTATLLNKYWVDELYDAAVVRPIHGAARAALALLGREGRGRRRQRRRRHARGRLGACCACSRPASSAPTRCSSRWAWSPCSSTS